MKVDVEKPTLQDQQLIHESASSFTEELAQNELAKTTRKEQLQFLIQQAQEFNLGYE